MLESLYDQDPTMALNETFSSQNTVRWTIVGTPTFSNGTMTTSAVGNYINTNYDFSWRTKFTVRIKWTYTANKYMSISQWDSSSKRLWMWTSNDWYLYFLLDSTGSQYWRVAITWWTYDWVFIYDWTQSTNATKVKIYINWVIQTLNFAWTIPTSVSTYTSKNSRIWNWFTTTYLLNDCVFEQVQIWNRVLWADEILARYNNSIYKNVNPIMNIRKWIKGTGVYTETYQTTADTIVPIGQKIFTCGTAGTLSLPSKWANGTVEFSLYKGADVNGPLIYFMNGSTGVVASAINDYEFIFNINESISLRRTQVSTILFSTGNSYASINTWYRYKITRSITGVFTLYIKGGSFGTSYVLLTKIAGGSGTNPITDNTYTSSSFFVADLDAADQISDIRFTPYIV